MTPPRVVHISTVAGEGGAGKAALRLHSALVGVGIDSKLLVAHRAADWAGVVGSQTVSGRFWSRVRQRVDQAPLRLLVGGQAAFSLHWLPSAAVRTAMKLDPDILHLHWVGDAFVPIESLRRVRCPIVWTLHDMWPFSGGCHYAGSCTRFTERCGACPQLGGSRQLDLSRWVLRRKVLSWSRLNITAVCPSRWMAAQAGASALLSDRRRAVLPNAIPLDTFKPLPSPLARALFDVPPDARTILFAAGRSTTDARKGFALLRAALQSIVSGGNSADYQLIVVGNEHSVEDLRFPTMTLGVLRDEQTLAAAYNAADVFVAPSIEDNLPNTVAEALACGTPCVAFDIGGMPDMISHRENGYLCRPYEPLDLARGIRWALSRANDAGISSRARASAETLFEPRRVADDHADLYRELLANATRSGRR